MTKPAFKKKSWSMIAAPGRQPPLTGNFPGNRHANTRQITAQIGVLRMVGGPARLVSFS
jgi:hypothetical protein